MAESWKGEGSSFVRGCIAFIRALSAIVPPAHQREWRLEWTAEIYHRGQRLGRHRRLTRRARLDMIGRCLGAVPHALWVWKEDWRLDMLIQDIRYAIRTHFKKPAFALLAVGTLALGIGANTMIFSFVNTVLLQPMNFEDPDGVVYVWDSNPSQGFPKFSVSPANFVDYRDQVDAFAGVAAYNRTDATLVGVGDPRRIPGALVTQDFFEVARTGAALGRVFEPAEMTIGNDDVVMISHGLWTREFGSDESIIGQVLNLDGRMRTVVGVTPTEFDFPIGADLWIPLVFDFDVAGSRGAHYLVVIGRLDDGQTIEQAQQQLDVVTANLEQEYPNNNTGWTARLFPVHGEIVDGARTPLIILSGAVGLVLLIACANVANLFLARNSTRRRELAIRYAIGAGRMRILRQLLAESLLLAVCGGLAGLLLAYSSVGVLVSLIPAGVPRLQATTIDPSVLLFTLAISLATGIAFGIAPAVRAARSGFGDSLSVGGALADGGRSGLRLRSGLVVVEVALALVVVVGSGLLAQSLWRLMSVDPGFEAGNAAVIELGLPSARYPDARERARFYDDLTARIAALPGVRSVGVVSDLPMTGQFNISYSVAGLPPLAPGQNPGGEMRFVHPDYFQTMGIPLIRGRGFGERDNAESPDVVVINETLARAIFPDEDPLGQRLDIGYRRTSEDGTRPREIVGIVADVREMGLDRPAPPAYYVPYRQDPMSKMYVVARTDVDASSLMPAIGRVVHEMDPGLAILTERTLDQTVALSLTDRRMTAGFLVGFALLAAGHGRCLRRDGVFGRSAAERNWYPDGSRCTRPRRARHVRSERFSGSPRRRGSGAYRGPRVDPPASGNVVRGRGHRPHDLRVRRRAPGYRIRPCQPDPGATGDVDGSPEGAPFRVTATSLMIS